MPFDPKQFAEGQNYDGVIRAAKVIESQSGNPGIWFRVETELGAVDGAQYVTPRTKDRFAETMEQLGITIETLAGAEFWTDPAPFLVDTECSIVPEINEYEGKESWRVKWLNPRRKQATAQARDKAKMLFQPGGGAAFGGGVIAPEPDVPF